MLPSVFGFKSDGARHLDGDLPVRELEAALPDPQLLVDEALGGNGAFTKERGVILATGRTGAHE